MFKFSRSTLKDEGFSAEAWDKWEDEAHFTDVTRTDWQTCLLSLASGERRADTDKDSEAFSQSCFDILPKHLELWFCEEPSTALRLPHLFWFGDNDSWSLIFCSVSIPAGCWMNANGSHYCHKLLRTEDHKINTEYSSGTAKVT